LRDQERAFYTYATDDEALAAFHELARTEGHHSCPGVSPRRSRSRSSARQPCGGDQILLVNLSGRGDKDLDTVLRQSQT
jgi:tryptophan synthase beta chain